MRNGFKSKPAAGARVNFGHPLAQDLRLAILLNEGSGFRVSSAANPMHVATATDANSTWTAGKHGRAIKATSDGGTAFNFGSGHASLNPGGDRVTVMVCAELFSQGQFNRCFVSNPTGNATVHWGIGKTNADAWVFWIDTGSLMSLSTTGVVGETRVVAGSYDGANGRIYLDGVEKNSTAKTGNISTGGNILIGGNSTGGNQNWKAPVYWGYMWARTLTQDEIEWVTAEPYALIAPQSPFRRYFLLDGQPVYPSAIASTAAFGTAVVDTPDQFLTGTGIASTAAFGTTKVAGPVTGTGIASTAGFGTASVALSDFFVTPTGIASTAALGTSLVSGPITATGRASTVAFGTAALTVATTNQTLTLTSIASTAAFGTTYIVGPPQYIVI
jgi:hypothetical protein